MNRIATYSIFIFFFLVPKLNSQISRSQCYICHSNPTIQKTVTVSGGTEIIPLYVDSLQYNNGLHHSLECIACHTDINSSNLYNHSLTKYYGSWARFSKSDTTLNNDGSPRTRNYYTIAAMSCNKSGCHASKAAFDSSNHHKIWRLKTARVRTVNGESVGENYDKSCGRCHATCSTCHFKAQYIQKYSGDLTSIWDSLHTYGEGSFPNAGAMSEWAMDWTTNVASHSFWTSNNLKANNDVCRSCHVGYYRPPVAGFIMETPPYSKAKATNIKRHPQFYESAMSSKHQTLKCANCHSDVHSYPGRKYDWQLEGDVKCQTCHNMTNHYAQHTTVDCISCHATGFGRSKGLGADIHDVFRWTENNRVRPLAVKYNEGLSWYPHNIEKPNNSTSCSAKCHYNGNLIGATVMSVYDITQSKPNSFSLEQNYPNPFNPNTSIQFSIAKTEQVKIVVYNAVGSIVKILVDEELRIGSYRAAWDATDALGNLVASGIYYYKLQTPSVTLTKKMVLIR